MLVSGGRAIIRNPVEKHHLSICLEEKGLLSCFSSNICVITYWELFGCGNHQLVPLLPDFLIT